MDRDLKHQQTPPSWRKPAGIFAILILAGSWIAIVARQADHIGQLPIWVQAIIYLLAGCVWLLPLRPLLIWMETGQWRE
jgi:Protein of unknown function (DUF2842)